MASRMKQRLDLAQLFAWRRCLHECYRTSQKRSARFMAMTTRRNSAKLIAAILQTRTGLVFVIPRADIRQLARNQEWRMAKRFIP